MAVACHTLVDVLISRSSERLDPQHGSSASVKLYGLDSHMIYRVAYISHSRVSMSALTVKKESLSFLICRVATFESVVF